MKFHVKKKIKNSLKIIGFICSSQSMYGEVSFEQTFIVTGSSSQFFVVMDRENVATCYRAEKPGIVKQVWEAKGWYSSCDDLFLSQNGRTLVRVLEIEAMNDPIRYANQISIEIYVSGNISSQYRVKHLVNLSVELPESLDAGIKLLKRTPRSARIVTVRELARLGIEAPSERWDTWFPAIARTNDAFSEYFLLETSQDARIIIDLNEGKIVYKEMLAPPHKTIDSFFSEKKE